MPSLVPLRLGAGKSAKFPISGRGAMGTSLRIAGLLCASVLIFISGCNRIARSWYLSSYDRDISSSTKAIDTAPTITPTAQKHMHAEATPIRKKPAIAGLSS